ncbi:MAG: hypothetical protein KF810_15250 [Rhizobiaceae bacterium]|nr:hypothetical protein [Rhizobiaceae bacterium]
MSPTEIRSNGTRTLGDTPDSIETLLDVLAHHPLNRMFERVFIENLGNGSWRFHGNFLTVSHVFDIRSDDPETVRLLTRAINANRRMPGFRSQPSAAKQWRAIRQMRGFK